MRGDLADDEGVLQTVRYRSLSPALLLLVLALLSMAWLAVRQQTYSAIPPRPVWYDQYFARLRGKAGPTETEKERLDRSLRDRVANLPIPITAVAEPPIPVKAQPDSTQSNAVPWRESSLRGMTTIALLASASDRLTI